MIYVILFVVVFVLAFAGAMLRRAAQISEPPEEDFLTEVYLPLDTELNGDITD